MIEAELLRQHEGFRHRDHRYAEDHVVADLRRLPVAGAAGVHDGLAHLLQDRLRARKSLRAAADHEGERRRGGATDAAGDRRIEHQQPFLFRRARDRARGFHVDGGAVDQQRARIGVLDDAGRAEIDLAHFLARRQHGDDQVGARGGRLGGLDAGAAGRHQLGDRGRIDVHALDLVAGLEQVLRHRQTHIAEPDKSYARHGALPDLHLRMMRVHGGCSCADFNASPR